MYVDSSADREAACRLVIDAKCNYPAACNAMETLLVHSSHLGTGLAQELVDQLHDAGVTTFGGPLAAIELGLEPAAKLGHE